jgi:hypothetical protein
LSKEVKQLRDNLLHQVDDLIMRQDKCEPINKIETFQVETASRRVLKDLTETFLEKQEEQNKKISALSTSNE